MLRLEVVGHFSDGSVRNLTQKAIFSSGDPLIQATPDGMVRADRGGDTAVLVRYADQMVNARVTFVPARQAFAWKPVPEFNWIDTLNFRRLKQLHRQIRCLLFLQFQPIHRHWDFQNRRHRYQI